MGLQTLTGLTFTVMGPGLTPVTGTRTYSSVGATATFTPASPLAAGVLFTATITTGAQDFAGNPFAVPFTWTFTTGSGPDAIAPAVTSTTPANGETMVAPNAGINATFSKAMDPATLTPATFTLVGPGPTFIAGKITYDAINQIATFTPKLALATGSLYTATVTTGVMDLGKGNALAANVSWNLTTGSTPSLLPVDLGAASGFAVLAQATVTNANATMLTGDLGLTPRHFGDWLSAWNRERDDSNWHRAGGRGAGLADDRVRRRRRAAGTHYCGPKPGRTSPRPRPLIPPPRPHSRLQERISHSTPMVTRMPSGSSRCRRPPSP